MIAGTAAMRKEAQRLVQTIIKYLIFDAIMHIANIVSKYVVPMHLLYFSKIVVVKSRSEKYLNVFTKISISIPEFDLLRSHFSGNNFFNIVADK